MILKNPPKINGENYINPDRCKKLHKDFICLFGRDEKNHIATCEQNEIDYEEFSHPEKSYSVDTFTKIEYLCLIQETKNSIAARVAMQRLLDGS